MCYKDLYFDEKKLREELNTCLQNEKDVSANARHNHKRVMDQLKEDLSGKSEEVEVNITYAFSKRSGEDYCEVHSLS